MSGTQLAVCVDVTCISPAACVLYDIPTRSWSRLDVPFTPEGASPPGASCGAAEGPVLPPRFRGPEKQAIWAATLAGGKLQACSAPGASDCITLTLRERWAAPPQVVVSADRTGAVVWGKPDGKRPAAEIYDARSGRFLRALEAFPGNRWIAPWQVMEVGYWGNVLWATWPACEACPSSQTWLFDARGHDPRRIGDNPHYPPAHAPYDDQLELVHPDESGNVLLLDCTTGASVGTYPLGYRNRWGGTLLAIAKGQFALVSGGRAVRSDHQGDDDHPDVAEVLFLDIDGARAGRPVVQRGVSFPRCKDESAR